MHSRVLLAVFCQLNLEIFLVPRSINLSFNSRSVKILEIDPAMSLTLSGWTNIPPLPTISGKEETLETTVGVPQAIASKGGNPKPSKKDG